jgi:Ca-activated chloride channel family protein
MKPRIAGCLILAGLAALALPRIGRSQGIIVDRHRPIPIAQTFEIREVSVDARVRDQVAEVQISQTFHNPGSFQIDTEYFFPMPEEGAIQNFVLMVDGREMPGRLLPKDEARRIYEEIVRTKRDPALLEYMGRGLFKTSVFPIPPNADRKVTMRYTQICKRDHDLVEFAYLFATQKFTAKPIQRLSLTLRIESRDPIKSIYCPTYDARVERVSDHDARVSFEQRDVVPTNDFRVVYTLAEGAFGATVLSYRPTQSEDGYFLLLASPQVKPADTKPLPKTVIFVLDRSGSMTGKKIEQARKSLKFVLNNLRDDDTFNIIAYDDRVDSFKPELQRYSSRTREEAERFVDNIREGGATNIDSALKTALGMIPDDTRPSYILFLTDGLPTAGVTDEMAIAQNCKSANSKRARLFAFGVGFDVNARLLDRLSGGNSGTSEYVKPDEDIERYVSRFYSKMTSPVLSNIRIEFTGTDINRTYPRDIPDLFEGGQLIWVGRYQRSGRTTLRLTGKVGQESRSLEFAADLAEGDRGSAHDFVEKIWAMRRVGFIIDEIDLHGQNRELIDELVALSTKHGILTPYTSFLADERVQLHAFRDNASRAGQSLRDLGVTTGPAGVAQREAKQSFLSATNTPAASAAAEGQSEGLDTFTTRARMKRRSSGLGAGAGGMMGGMATGAHRSRNPVADAKAAAPAQLGQGLSEEAAQRSSVRHVGSKTFYFKNDRWLDSTVTPDEDSKATVLKQFSDEFFALARNQEAELNQYLTFREPVTVKLDGKVYRFDPPNP